MQFGQLPLFVEFLKHTGLPDKWVEARSGVWLRMPPS